MTVRTVIDWITDANTFFLLGAGCSNCAGKPLIGELTTKVSRDLSPNGKAILEDLKGVNNRRATVEDLVNYFLQLQKLISSRQNPSETGWTPASIAQEIAKIQSAIVREVGSEWAGCDWHKRFLTRLRIHQKKKSQDIFLLNYDTLIESSLEELKYQYTDGFRGSENAYFEPSLYDHPPFDSQIFKVYKLHGSINWVRDQDETVRRKPGKLINGTSRVVVYPAEQKYVQTQYGIYEVLLNRFRARLRESRPNNNLVIIGYSFNDEHINHAIEDGIRSDGSNVTVYAFVGPEQDIDKQKERFQEIASRCNHRFNAIIGGAYFVGSALSDVEWDKIKSLELWKFENLVNTLTGGLR